MHTPKDDNLPPVPSREKPTLSAMELRCLALAAEGRTPSEIVLATDLPMQRVADAMTNAVEKLEARNVTGAISRAVRLKLI